MQPAVDLLGFPKLRGTFKRGYIYIYMYMDGIYGIYIYIYVRGIYMGYIAVYKGKSLESSEVCWRLRFILWEGHVVGGSMRLAIQGQMEVFQNNPI